MPSVRLRPEGRSSFSMGIKAKQVLSPRLQAERSRGVKMRFCPHFAEGEWGQSQLWSCKEQAPVFLASGYCAQAQAFCILSKKSRRPHESIGST